MREAIDHSALSRFGIDGAVARATIDGAVARSTVDGAVARFSLLASAICRRPLQVTAGAPGAPAWTDGKHVFIDVQASTRMQIESLSVQASLLAAGSLDQGIVRRLSRRPALARRYLSLEGHRALTQMAPLLPPAVHRLIRADIAAATDSPARSLDLCRARRVIDDPPDSFGTICAKELLSALRREERAQAAGPLGAQPAHPLLELADDAETDDGEPDLFASPVGGGGPIGRWLQKLLTAMRQGKGGGSPGADAPTHWTGAAARGPGQGAFATAGRSAGAEAPADDHARGVRYPEWDVHGHRYRANHCTVIETASESRSKDKLAPGGPVPDHADLRRALARLGLGIDRYHRQRKGDDLDIDAVIEARVSLLAGLAPDEAIFIDSIRLRRDLAVLLLLDISGSAAEPDSRGKSVHEVQRDAAAALSLALRELGDRVALYAYHSQGRSAVHLTPVKRFGEDSGARLWQRLRGLEPGGFSRLGAAIRHGTAVLQEQAGTPRQLLVVLSDGLAYDHGYERDYGAADARRALDEARQQGVGCLCLSAGSSTDGESLRRVFGAAAHAALPAHEQLHRIIGPLFRSALGAADLRRRVS